MVRSFAGGLCAVGLAALMTSMASAATIQQVLADDFDPTQDNYVDYFGGMAPSAYMLTWEPDPANQNKAPSGHRPGGPPDYGPAGGNPDWLKFDYLSNGGGVGGGGGGAGNWLSTFKLGNEYGNDWTMDFYVLIFDAGFAGEEINVYLIGEDPANPDNYKMATVEAGDVITGKMLKFTIDAAAAEEVTVHVESVGDESYAAGFFMDNENVGVIPEPATLALLAAGLACVVARRRRR